MSESCGTCRFWVELGSTTPKGHFDQDYRFSIPPAPGFDYENWPAEKHREMHAAADQAKQEAWPGPWGTCTRERFTGSPMFTNDASDYFSALRTRAEHYCAAYEVKP